MALAQVQSLAPLAKLFHEVLFDSTVVNLDPSSAQALSDDICTSLASLLFHEVLFDHNHPPPVLMAALPPRAGSGGGPRRLDQPAAEPGSLLT